MQMITTLKRDIGIGINNYRSYDVTMGNYTIQTLVTASPSQVGQWLATNTRNPDHHPMIVGLDVEWRPNTEPNRRQPNRRQPNRRQPNPVATLQLCIGSNCLIFQILHAPSIPRALTSFLANPGVRFVGVAVQEDADKLQRDYNLLVANAVDLRCLAAQKFDVFGLHMMGLAALGDFVLGLGFDRPHYITMSAWDNRFLTHAQVQYAAIDAFVSCEIGSFLILSFLIL